MRVAIVLAFFLKIAYNQCTDLGNCAAIGSEITDQTVLGDYPTGFTFKLSPNEDGCSQCTYEHFADFMFSGKTDG